MVLNKSKMEPMALRMFETLTSRRIVTPNDIIFYFVVWYRQRQIRETWFKSLLQRDLGPIYDDATLDFGLKSALNKLYPHIEIEKTTPALANSIKRRQKQSVVVASKE